MVRITLPLCIHLLVIHVRQFTMSLDVWFVWLSLSTFILLVVLPPPPPLPLLLLLLRLLLLLIVKYRDAAKSVTWRYSNLDLAYS